MPATQVYEVNSKADEEAFVDSVRKAKKPHQPIHSRLHDTQGHHGVRAVQPAQQAASPTQEKRLRKGG